MKKPAGIQSEYQWLEKNHGKPAWLDKQTLEHVLRERISALGGCLSRWALYDGKLTVAERTRMVKWSEELHKRCNQLKENT